jgi:CubicO group peptidase (beta-lactamase class C family)
MQRAVDVGHISGALLWVGNGSGIGLLESVGTQTQDSSTPVTTDSIFRIYSMTKPIISVAAMSLVESGQLGLDDPVSDYLPSFLGLQVIDSATGDIRPANNTMTIRHLLTHQSGIVQQPFAMNTPLGPLYRDSFPDILTRPDPDAVGASFMEAFNTISAQDLAARIGQLPVLFEPGTAWHYGHSTDVLGAVLEVASGQTLDDLLADRIFGPLSMKDTSFWVDEKDASRVAEPIFGPMTDNTRVRGMLAGGHGLNSTAEDYARFALMLLNGGALDGTRILSASGLDLMREGTLGPGVSRQYFFYGDIGDWGLGFHLQPTTDDPDGPHNFGWRGIGGTLFLVDEENDFYLIYMVQKWGGPDDTPFTNDIAARMVYEAMRN